MRRRTARRAAVVALAVGVAAVAAGAGQAADDDPDAALAATVAAGLEAQAAAYVRYREDIATLEATPFEGPETTREAHRRLAGHDIDDLAAGWVAHAALIAAETPEFREALRLEIENGKKEGRRDRLSGRDVFIARMAADPTYPRSLPGADAAVARVLTTALGDSARMHALGEAFKEQAYALQKVAWGKSRIAEPSERLAEVEAFTRTRAAPAAPPPPAAARLEESGIVTPELAALGVNWVADWGPFGESGQLNALNADVIADRVLNLAARYATGTLNPKIVEVYARNDKSNSCLSLAELTLRQCIAATRAPYEEAFCLGEHAINDVAGCLDWVAGAPGAS